ncbi:MAG: ArsR family transcriptional regulator [Rhodospirillaceae bacterium]|nr:ArsR family transcriptional regulator [Rhodospirillaceae bacterium]
MMERLDDLDRKILVAMQNDASRSLEEIATSVGSSKTPVWNRIKKLKARGIIERQIAIVNPDAVGLGMCFYVLVKTAQHEATWIERFLAALKRRPEILEAHRLAGDVDYILKVRVADAAAYDAFYRALTADVSIFNVTSLLSMEELVSTTKLAIDTIE